MRTAIVVGNPRPRSRTFAAAQLIIELLTGRPADLAVDLVDFGPALLDRTDPSVRRAVDEVGSSDLVVFASPTYKATYTGLLKLFCEHVGAGSFAGLTAVPLMLGADSRHSLAPEVFLKPLLSELGASTPTPGLFLIDSEYATSPALDTWLAQARRIPVTSPS